MTWLPSTYVAAVKLPDYWSGRRSLALFYYYYWSNTPNKVHAYRLT